MITFSFILEIDYQLLSGDPFLFICVHNLAIYLSGLNHSKRSWLIQREVDNVTQKETVFSDNITSNTRLVMQRVKVDMVTRTSGRYQVLVTPVVSGYMVTDMVQSVFLTRPSYGQKALSFVTAVLVTVLLVGVILSIFKQWRSKEHRSQQTCSQLARKINNNKETENIYSVQLVPDHSVLCCFFPCHSGQ